MGADFSSLRLSQAIAAALTSMTRLNHTTRCGQFDNDNNNTRAPAAALGLSGIRINSGCINCPK